MSLIGTEHWHQSHTKAGKLTHELAKDDSDDQVSSSCVHSNYIKYGEIYIYIHTHTQIPRGIQYVTTQSKDLWNNNNLKPESGRKQGE